MPGAGARHPLLLEWSLKQWVEPVSKGAPSDEQWTTSVPGRSLWLGRGDPGGGWPQSESLTDRPKLPPTRTGSDRSKWVWVYSPPLLPKPHHLDTFVQRPLGLSAMPQLAGPARACFGRCPCAPLSVQHAEGSFRGRKGLSFRDFLSPWVSAHTKAFSALHSPALIPLPPLCAHLALLQK